MFFFVLSHRTDLCTVLVVIMPLGILFFFDCAASTATVSVISSVIAHLDYWGIPGTPTHSCMSDAFHFLFNGSAEGRL